MIETDSWNFCLNLFHIFVMNCIIFSIKNVLTTSWYFKMYWLHHDILCIIPSMNLKIVIVVLLNVNCEFRKVLCCSVLIYWPSCVMIFLLYDFTIIHTFKKMQFIWFFILYIFFLIKASIYKKISMYFFLSLSRSTEVNYLLNSKSKDKEGYFKKVNIILVSIIFISYG